MKMASTSDRGGSYPFLEVHLPLWISQRIKALGEGKTASHFRASQGLLLLRL